MSSSDSKTEGETTQGAPVVPSSGSSRIRFVGQFLVLYGLRLAVVLMHQEGCIIALRGPVRGLGRNICDDRLMSSSNVQ